MVCNNCGKSIKDVYSGKCEFCGEKIIRKFEGNGFYDILQTEEEQSAVSNYPEDNVAAESVGADLLTELIRIHKITNKMLKKQLQLSCVMIILSFVIIAVSTMFFVSFMKYNDRGNNAPTDNLPVTNIADIAEKESEGAEIFEDAKEEIIYSVTLEGATEEQLAVFTSGKEIKIKGSVLGQITDNKDGVLTIKASIIKDGEKILLSNNTEIEIAFGQDYDLFVDGVSIKGRIQGE